MAKRRGRKPKGGEARGLSAVFSTRISPQLRKKLEDAANSRGRSLSQEINRRLEDSFGIQSQKDPALRAICYLIGEIAIRTCGDWRRDPWHFQAFRAGVGELLNQMAPRGRLIVPKGLTAAFGHSSVLAEHLKAPEQFGALIATTLVAQLLSGQPPSSEVELEVPAGTWPYAMPHARRELGIESVPIDLSSVWAALRQAAADNRGDGPDYDAKSAGHDIAKPAHKPRKKERSK